MSYEIVTRLLESFNSLEEAILAAQTTLAEKGPSAQPVLERINSYFDILQKERFLAHELSDALSRGEWEVVVQKVQVINGLLDMIHKDARETIQTLVCGEDLEGEDEAEMLIC